jgi:hypothetical protein
MGGSDVKLHLFLTSAFDRGAELRPTLRQLYKRGKTSNTPGMRDSILEQRFLRLFGKKLFLYRPAPSAVSMPTTPGPSLRVKSTQIHKYEVPTAQRTHCIFETKTTWLLPLMKFVVKIR